MISIFSSDRLREINKNTGKNKAINIYNFTIKDLNKKEIKKYKIKP